MVPRTVQRDQMPLVQRLEILPRAPSLHLAVRCGRAGAACCAVGQGGERLRGEEAARLPAPLLRLHANAAHTRTK